MIPFVSVRLEEPPISEARGRRIRIAVLDSGVNRANPHVGNIEGGFSIGLFGEKGEDVTDRLGHGTAVVAAIQEKAPHAEILVLRIFADELSTTVRGLAGALESAVEAGVHLVNLSLGTPGTGQVAMLLNVVRRAVAAGVLVVSPREHRGRRWWPGSFPGTVGVFLDHSCPRDEIRMIEGPEGEPVFRASGLPRPIPGIPADRNLSGISFAAANVTGVLARLLEIHPGVEKVADLTAVIGGGGSGAPKRGE